MTVPMALVDYIPVFLFLTSAVLLLRDLYNKMSKGAFSLFASGSICVFMAGCAKATWKLLYAAMICDFVPLNKMFFPVQALGFMLAGLGLVAMLIHPQGEGKVYAVAAVPAVYQGTMIFVCLMVLGVIGMNTSLAVVAAKRKKPVAAVLFILSIVFMLGMGYLSSKDFSGAVMNWVAQGVNIWGQGMLLFGTLILHKDGLEKTVL